MSRNVTRAKERQKERIHKHLAWMIRSNVEYPSYKLGCRTYLQVLEVVSFIAIFPRVAVISHAVRLGVNVLRSFRGQRTHLNGFLVKRFL